MTQTTNRPARRPGDRLPRQGDGSVGRGREIRVGALGVLGIAVLIIGIPVALSVFVGYPLPRSAPSKDWLTQSVTATLIIKILACVVWLLWAHFAVCIIAEWRALRHGRLPGDVPFGGGSQMLARRLVASALLLAGTATAFGNLSTGSSAASPTMGQAVVQSAQHPALDAAQQQQVRANTATADAQAHQAAEAQVHHAAESQGTKTYTVKPPDGRHYDTLWDIAHRTLGDPLRYKEIFALNKDRAQTDGSKLHDANLIRPGWQLRLPSDASGPGVHTAHVAAPPTSEASVPPVATPSTPAPATPAPTQSGVAAHAPAASGATNALHGAEHTASSAGQGASLDSELFGGGLMLAGILLALSARRGPYAPTAVEEDALAGVADADLANGLDRALRNLAAGRAEQGRELPQPIAAWASTTDVALTMAAGDFAQPPKPWTLGDDARTWQVSLAAVTGTYDDVAAPFPALAAVGRADGYELFVDLEQAPGIVSLAGDVERARDLATAVAVQMGTCAWSDGARVTLVGFGNGDQIAATAPGSIGHAPRLAKALEDFEAEHRAVAALRRRLGIDGVLTGRRTRRSADWRPHLLVLSGPPTPQEALRLQAVIGDSRSQFIAIVVGDVESARWRFAVDAEGGLDLGALGVSAQAHHLGTDGITRLAELAAAAAQNRTATTANLQSATPGDTVRTIEPAPQRTVSSQPSVEVKLLGPVSVAAQGPVEDAKRDLLTGLVVAVALHPDGMHEAVLRTSLWPRGVSDEVFAATVADASTWLGRDTAGRAALRDDNGRWSLGDTVRIDWDEMRRLAATATGQQELAHLTQALALVHGEAFDTSSSTGYRWLAFLRATRDARRVGTVIAHRAAQLHLSAGRPAEAEQALRQGLQLVPAAEVLWRDLLRLAADRDPRSTSAVAQEMYESLSQMRVWPEAETDALVAQVAPEYQGAGSAAEGMAPVESTG